MEVHVTAWSPEIANEFIRLAQQEGVAFTQMQLQKLVYIAHGWSLAIRNLPLTFDAPEAWDYGPVFRELRNALRSYGKGKINALIRNCDFTPGVFSEEPEAPAMPELSNDEKAVIERVYRGYGKYHAYQLSALTHQPDTPWSDIYKDGVGRSHEIPADLIRKHFIELASSRAT